MYIRALQRSLIILIDLPMTSYSENMMISHRCIHSFMPNFHKKSWMVSECSGSFLSCVRVPGFPTKWPPYTVLSLINLVVNHWGEIDTRQSICHPIAFGAKGKPREQNKKVLPARLWQASYTTKMHQQLYLQQSLN